MAVISIHEIWKGRDGESTLDDTQYTRVFRVWTNSGSDTADTIMLAMASTPWFVYPGVLYPTDTRAFCASVRPNNDLGNRGWLVTASYTSKQEFAERPENDPVKISWDEEDIEVPIVKDRNGHAVLNSAGDPPDPPVMASDSILIARITCNAASRPAYIRAYRKAINTDAFTIDGLTVNARHARVRRISMGENKYRGSYPFRDISIELAILDNDEDDWDIRFLDAGFRRRMDMGGTPPEYQMQKIVNDDNTEPSQAVPLDGGGMVLHNPTPDTCVFQTVEWYRRKTFVGVIPGCV